MGVEVSSLEKKDLEYMGDEKSMNALIHLDSLGMENESDYDQTNSQKDSSPPYSPQKKFKRSQCTSPTLSLSKDTNIPHDLLNDLETSSLTDMHSLLPSLPIPPSEPHPMFHQNLLDS